MSPRAIYLLGELCKVQKTAMEIDDLLAAKKANIDMLEDLVERKLRDDLREKKERERKKAKAKAEKKMNNTPASSSRSGATKRKVDDEVGSMWRFADGE